MGRQGPGQHREEKARGGPPAWWTEADLAELDALAWAFVRDFNDVHRPRCALCLAGLGVECPGPREAVDALVEWAVFRDLLSWAAWLREHQDDLEALTWAEWGRAWRELERRIEENAA